MPVHDWGRVDAKVFHMPAYLDASSYVPVPLESAYQAAWSTCPADLRELVETGKLPGEDD